MFFFGKKDLTFNDIKELYQKGQIHKAMKACEEYFKKVPGDFDALNLLGEIYYKLGKKDKVITLYQDMVKQLESEKYLEKAAAVLRKGIKYYPDQYDFYIHLASIFEKKGLVADQVSVLKDLSTAYEKTGDIDKMLDALSEAFEKDKNNYNLLKLIIQKIKKYDKILHLNRYFPNALEVAFKNNDKDMLFELIEYGISYGFDFGSAIRYTLEYFKTHGEKLDFYIKIAQKSLLEHFDEHLFSDLTHVVDIEANRDFFFNLYEKINHPALYRIVLDLFIKDKNTDAIVKMVDKIRGFNEHEFDRMYAELFYERIDELPVDAIYDNLLVIAKRADHSGLKEKTVSLVSVPKDIKKAEPVDLNKLDEAGTNDTILSLDIPDVNLIEWTQHFEDASTNNENTEKTAVLEPASEQSGQKPYSANTLELDLHRHDDLELASEFDNEEIFEIDLTEHMEDEVVLNEFENSELQQVGDENQNELLDILDETLLNTYGQLSIEDSLEVDNKAANLSKELNELKKLILQNKINEAKNKFEQLLALEPENDALKDMAMEIYGLEGEDQSLADNKIYAEVFNKEEKDSFRKVVNNIKRSIEQTVSPEDYEMHYDLAHAYFEMELYDEAIEELKKSAVGKLRYQALILMSECYKRKKSYNEGIDIMKLIMIDYGSDPEVMKNAIYEIARMYELKGDLNTSITYYNKLNTIDPSFMDVAQKVSADSAHKIKVN